MLKLKAVAEQLKPILILASRGSTDLHPGISFHR
jgi:hypothetical protein